GAGEARASRRRLRRRDRCARERRRREVLDVVRGAQAGHPREARRPRCGVTTATDLVERIWERDPTVWTGADEAQWLGWLDEPLRMQEQLDELLEFANEVVSAGAIDDVVVLGMGGSSLAPEVLRRAFAAEHFHVLDTTHP